MNKCILLDRDGVLNEEMLFFDSMAEFSALVIIDKRSKNTKRKSVESLSFSQISTLYAASGSNLFLLRITGIISIGLPLSLNALSIVTQYLFMSL